MAEQIDLDFGTDAIHFAYPTLRYTVIRVSSKIKEKYSIPSGTLLQTLDLEENFATFLLLVNRQNCCQLRWTLSVINWRRSSVTSLSH